MASSWKGYALNQSKEYSIKYYLNKNIHKKDYAWVKASDISKNMKAKDLHKVYIPAAGGSGTDSQILGVPFYGEPNSVCSHEQEAKGNWKGEDNPYAALPRMVLLAYKLPDTIQSVALQGEYNEFDLNAFFSTKTTEDGVSRFVYENEVQKWLKLIRGAYIESDFNELKLGAEKPPLPFSDTRLLNVLSHTLWFLPNVAACNAMKNLLEQKQNVFYHDYKIIVVQEVRLESE